MRIDPLLRVWTKTDAGVDVSRYVVHLDDGTDDDTAWLVDTEWRIIGRRLQPTRVSVSSLSDPPTPVTGDVLKRIPFGTIQRDARRSLAISRDTLRRLSAKKRPPHIQQVIDDTLTLADASTGPQRGTRLTAADLEAVAAVYRVAADTGEPVTEAVAEAFFIAKSTAGKRIMRARAAGLLDGYEGT